MRGENISKKSPILYEKFLRSLVRKIILEDAHKWSVASDSLLMLDKEGMEKEDRENVSKFLKSMGMIL